MVVKIYTDGLSMIGGLKKPTNMCYFIVVVRVTLSVTQEAHLLAYGHVCILIGSVPTYVSLNMCIADIWKDVKVQDCIL